MSPVTRRRRLLLPRRACPPHHRLGHTIATHARPSIFTNRQGKREQIFPKQDTETRRQAILTQCKSPRRRGKSRDAQGGGARGGQRGRAARESLHDASTAPCEELHRALDVADWLLAGEMTAREGDE
ncbi:hypothetical protein E2C01_010722 [Portunus trituberculatus]|uniref:Uncharacterized protein n=1 Tax=Portunus trituberculatus TaxID=210409 RepID=A0A5B7D9M0_PORTR|nr:hypothetical protein [Portunus trituberculatus]